MKIKVSKGVFLQGSSRKLDRFLKTLNWYRKLGQKAYNLGLRVR